MNAFPGLVPVPRLDLLPPGLFCLHPATLSWGTFGSDTSIASLGIWLRSVFLGKHPRRSSQSSRYTGKEVPREREIQATPWI